MLLKMNDYRKHFSKGQSLVEIVTFLAIVVLAFAAMQTYIQRGIQGKTKVLTDRIIGRKQRAYSATSSYSKSKTSSTSNIKVSTKTGGSTEKAYIRERTTTKSSSYTRDK